MNTRALTKRPSQVIVAGASRSAAHVHLAVTMNGFGVERAADAKEAARAIGPDTVAVALILGRDAASGAAAVREVLRSVPGGRMPVFAAVPRSYPTRSVQRMYAVGATAVVEWPTESLEFAGLLRDLIEAEGVHDEGSAQDRRLARAVQARIDHLDEARRIDVSARGGVIHLSGWVKDFPDRLEIERRIADLPGVEAIRSRDVSVGRKRRPDAELVKDARTVLQRAAGVDEATLSTVANSGVLTLAGTVKSRAELDRAIALLGSLDGVKDVTNLATISPAQKRIDKRRRMAAARALKALLPDSQLNVKVFGKVAVVSGRVPMLRDKRDAETIVLRKLPLERVVNKIRVDA